MNKWISFSAVAALALWIAGCSAVSEPVPPSSASGKAAGSWPLSIQRDQDGTYTAGKWTYIYTITNPGTRSQGAVGRLLYDGRQLPGPDNPADWYDTPLGRFFYAGEAKMLWEEQGWLPASGIETAPGGRCMPLPQDDLVHRAREEMAFLLAELISVESGKDWQEERPEQEELTGRIDPWGTKYNVWPDIRSSEGGGQVSRLVIQSAGPDRVFGTNDDLVRNSGFARTDSRTLEEADDMRPAQ